jgi:hypothetical protein
MEKWMCLGSLAVAVIFILVFIVDFVVGMPFGNGKPGYDDSPFMLVDIGGILAAGVLGYLGWNAFRENR